MPARAPTHAIRELRALSGSFAGIDAIAIARALETSGVRLLNAIFGQRRVQTILALCLPLFAVQGFGIYNLGYLLLVPSLLMAWILLKAFNKAAREGGRRPHG